MHSLMMKAAMKLPILLRLTRRGDTITAEYSRDNGKSFQPAGKQFDIEVLGYIRNDPATTEIYTLLPRIQAMTVHDGRVVAIYDIANPDKFTGSPLK